MKKIFKVFIFCAIVSVLFFAVGNDLARASISATIEKCGANELKAGNECRDVGIFVTLLIDISKYLFGIVGALALLFFIYGGFALILSQGNPEKVKKGTGAMAAAFIGLVIVFAAYVLVQFLGQAVGLQDAFKLK